MDPIIQVVVETAGKVMTKEVKMLYRVKEEVEEMKRELQWMQSFLDDADHHNVTSQSQSRVFRQQVLEVREARLDAEDIVDTYSVKLALRKRSGVMNHIKRYACIPRRGRDIYFVGLEIEAVKSKLETLRLRLQTYGLRELRLGDGPSSTPDGGNKSWQRRSYGHIPDRNVVGLDRHINEVIDMLLGGEENEPCRVVSIYGMGGLGKTTLAKKVYGHERMKRHFDKFAWVYVSQQFNARDAWESTLAELTSQKRKDISELNNEQLFAQLSQVQKDHKCLVVLDDVWSIQAWEQLIVGFRIEENRSQSKILFTSRKEEVAVNASRKGSYGKLKPLSNEESLELLRKTALEGRDHEIADDQNKDNLAEGMIEHCGGLPLAIIVLGGVLATKDSLREWQTVHDNVNAYLRRGRGHNEEQGLGLHQVLAYSYYDLPLQLKTCFLYLSQFPEDYEIPTSKLMKMWMAEGFVSVEFDGEGEETMEDVADRYLNDLVGRCVVEVGKKGSSGRIKTCRVHDMMREVCLSRAKEENFIHNVQREGTSNAAPKGKIRRLSFFGDATRSQDELSLSGYERNSQVRSLSLCNDVFYPSATLAPVHLADSFKLLRMLLLEGIAMAQMKDASKEIGKLIHLKYLSLRMSKIYDFPSMDKLGCMETLDLRVFSVRKKMCLIKIGEIWKMNQLRHLYLPYEWVVSYSTDGDDLQIEGNPNLQTLVSFPPPNCKVGRILNFPNLRKLDIMEGEHIRLQFWEILNNNTGFSLSSLHSLCLDYPSDSVLMEENGSNGDLELLFKRCPHLYKLDLGGPIAKFPQLSQFPNELTKLILSYSRIQDPEHIETTLGKLPNLRILQLVEAFNGEQLSFKKGTFLQLKYLKLILMTELNSWTVEHGAMPNLEHLEINQVRKLATVPEGLRSIATLNKLEIRYMPTQFAERLKEGGADFDNIVKHVPSITFKHCSAL